MNEIVIAAADISDAVHVASQVFALGGRIELLQDSSGMYPILVKPTGLSDLEQADLEDWCMDTGRWVGNPTNPGPAGPVAEFLLKLAHGDDPGGLSSRTISNLAGFPAGKGE